MACTVLEPMAWGGRRSSMRGSLLAEPTSASSERPSPGAMAPPTYAPSALTRSKLVLVPRSMTMAGPPNSFLAARALASRSAPASEGRSISISRMPSRLRASTVSGARPVLARIIRVKVVVRGGTTLAMATASTSPSACPPRFSRLPTRTATSSSVAAASVVPRHEPSSVPYSKRPRVRFVLPMSAASSFIRPTSYQPPPAFPGPRAGWAIGPSVLKCPVLDSPTPTPSSETAANRHVRRASQAVHQYRRRHRQDRHLQHPAPAAEADGQLRVLPPQPGREFRDRMGGARGGRPPGDRQLLHAALDLRQPRLLRLPAVRHHLRPAAGLHAGDRLGTGGARVRRIRPAPGNR